MVRVPDSTHAPDGIQPVKFGFMGPFVTNGTMVLIRGELRGMGQRGECDILARRVDVQGSDRYSRSFEYVDCSILTAPSELPDGDYICNFEGFSMLANRARGIWFSNGPAVRDSHAKGMEAGRMMNVVESRQPEQPAAEPHDVNYDLGVAPKTTLG